MQNMFCDDISDSITNVRRKGFGKAMEKEKKKIGLIGALLMGIGCIIGSGIFGTMPTVAAEYGPAIVYALLGAALVVILRAMSLLYTSSALPTTAAQFMWASKLFHPVLGAFVSISSLLMPTMVSLFGVLFADYFLQLIPGLNISTTAASVGLLVVFAIVAWFGNKTSVTVSNVMVVLLLLAIFLYVALGIPNIDAENVTFGEIIRPGIGLSTIAAAVGVLTSSLSGASSVAQLANDIKRPERNVPIALALCPLFVAIVYVLMAVVTIGVVPYAEVTTLADVASHFMSPALLTFFIVGGPICGIITSLVPVALACVALVEYSARMKVFPSCFARRNSHGTAYWSLVLVMGIAIAICATGATFGVVMTIFSFVNTLAEIPNTITPILAHRKYPKTCDNSPVKMPYPLAVVLSIVTGLICAYLCYEMILTLDLTASLGILAVYVFGFVYFFFRVRYLKGKGHDLIAEMKAPYEPWEEKERSYN